MTDDEPNGIQLRGKQLVFQAMSAIVVAVGIFLLGVMVGRGVPSARQQPPAALTQGNTADPLDPSSPLPPDELVPVGQDDGGQGSSTYQDELVSDTTGKTEVKPPDAKPQPFTVEPAVAATTAATTAAATAPTGDRRPESRAAAAEKPAPGPAVKAAESAVAKAAPARPAATEAPAPAGSGFVVQVAAYQRQGEANGVRDRLKSKGYPAFVTPASTASGTFYRVRVGSYNKETDAKSVAARLRRDEHLEPWVTR